MKGGGTVCRDDGREEREVLQVVRARVRVIRIVRRRAERFAFAQVNAERAVRVNRVAKDAVVVRQGDVRAVENGDAVARVMRDKVRGFYL